MSSARERCPLAKMDTLILIHHSGHSSHVAVREKCRRGGRTKHARRYDGCSRKLVDRPWREKGGRGDNRFDIEISARRRRIFTGPLIFGAERQQTQNIYSIIVAQAPATQKSCYKLDIGRRRRVAVLIFTPCGWRLPTLAASTRRLLIFIESEVNRRHATFRSSAG